MTRLHVTETAAPDAHRGDSFVTQNAPTITYRLSYEQFIPREVSLRVTAVDEVLMALYISKDGNLRILKKSALSEDTVIQFVFF